VNRAVFPAWHLATVDLGGLPGSLLSDAARLERTLGRAFADIAVVWFHHEFSPAGVSMTGASRAARVAVHTWPETGAATVDVWCADRDPAVLVDLAAAELRREASAASGSTDPSNGSACAPDR